MTPVTLYGLPGIQAEVSSHRLDGRIQVTSGSPSNPLSLSHAPQYAQWVVGGGYTIRQGLRVGISGFRGPYLSPDARAAAAGGNVGAQLSRPAAWGWRSSGRADIGAPAANGSASSTILPGFTQAPSVISTYGEAKRILTPRLYLAGRVGWLKPGGATDATGASTSQFSPWIASYELGGGWWLNRHQLLKASYEWLRIEHASGNADQCSGSPVRHHVPRHGPGVSLKWDESGGGAGLVAKDPLSRE